MGSRARRFFAVPSDCWRRGGARHRAGSRGLRYRLGRSGLLYRRQRSVAVNRAQFSTGKQVFNSFYNGSNPAAVVTVPSQADVQKAVSSRPLTTSRLPRVAVGIRTSAHPARPEQWCSTCAGFLAARTSTGQRQCHGHPGDEFVCGPPGVAGAGRAIPTGTCPTVVSRGCARRRDGGRFPARGPDLRCAAVGHGGVAQRRGGHRVCQQETRICSGHFAAVAAAISG